jgi:hypothetical protein
MTEHEEELEVTWREGKLSNFTVVDCFGGRVNHGGHRGHGGI